MALATSWPGSATNPLAVWHSPRVTGTVVGESPTFIAWVRTTA
jgi:hypothetical protein